MLKEWKKRENDQRIVRIFIEYPACEFIYLLICLCTYLFTLTIASSTHKINSWKKAQQIWFSAGYLLNRWFTH